MFAIAPLILWTFPCRAPHSAPYGDAGVGCCGWWECFLQSFLKIIGSLTKSIHLSTDARRGNEYSRDLGFACLFVADVHGSSGPIEWKHLQLPFDRDGHWQVAHGLVASLIFQLPRYHKVFPILPQRAPEL